MPIKNRNSTSGGRGNKGMFIERASRVCAAGIPSIEETPVSDCMQQYTLQDKVDALFHDSILPPLKPKQPVLRKPPPKDMRFASFHTEAGDLINPSVKSKFEQLAEDFKETTYASYWKKRVGKGPDHVPFLPKGMNRETTTFGKKFPYDGPLYEIMFPLVSSSNEAIKSKEPGVQVDRRFCNPPFTKQHTYGVRHGISDSGVYAKCVFTDDTRPYLIMNTSQVNFKNRTQAKIGEVLAPNANDSNVSRGHTFGIMSKPDSLVECLTDYPLNSGYIELKKCLTHINSVRKNISKRYLPGFFYDFYLKLRYFDKERTGSLLKSLVYDMAFKEGLRFDASLLEPLLSMWDAYDGTSIKYKTFVQMLHYKEPLPDLLKVPYLPKEYVDFRTTYSEMVKPGQTADSRLRAGLPAGRYMDLDYPNVPVGGCTADLHFLPGESTVTACLNPSIMTLNFVNHRDLYCVRERNVIRSIFKKADMEFTNEVFESLWNKSMKYHSQGLVCIESFRKAMLENPELTSH